MSRLEQSMLYGSSTSEQRLPALSFGQASGSSNKAGLSFPLGTGLVVLIILFVSTLFSLCYHWLRLRKVGSSPTPHRPPQPPSPDNSGKAAPPMTSKLGMLQCPPVVFMAGEEMPRFIAVPCAFVEGSYNTSTADAEEKGIPKPLDDLKLDIRL